MNGLIIDVSLKDRYSALELENIQELHSLIQTTGYKIVDKLKVSTSQIFVATFVSENTANNIAEWIALKEEDSVIDCLFFSEELSASQLFKLEKITGKMIMDRVEIIFRIFEMHARTKDAKIQVELAQLQYLLPRLKRMWTHLSRVQGGIGFTKGPGEKQIEIDRRILKERISKLKKQLKSVQQVKKTQRKKRIDSQEIRISLAGYTNAGKTSLLNILANQNLYAEDKLFATLSPVTRRVYLDSGLYCMMSDTVGFISKLPHFLIHSFHSTLQEIELSDYLLIVQDVSSEFKDSQLEVVQRTLQELNCHDKPYQIIFTKIDKLNDENLQKIKWQYPDALYVSNLTKDGIHNLKKYIIHNIIS